MAINRLRAANLAAEKADDEKFALSDSVDARIPGLLDGRGEGLRALFGSLDQALWEDSGWEKVGMHGVHPNKVHFSSLFNFPVIRYLYCFTSRKVEVVRIHGW
jgi:hypothetical protein